MTPPALSGLPRSRFPPVCEPLPFDNQVEGGTKPGLRIEFRRIRQTYIGKHVAAALDHLILGAFSHASPRNPAAESAPQYFCTLGSISSAQAWMPPARLTTLG